MTISSHFLLNIIDKKIQSIRQHKQIYILFQNKIILTCGGIVVNAEILGDILEIFFDKIWFHRKDTWQRDREFEGGLRSESWNTTATFDDKFIDRIAKSETFHNCLRAVKLRKIKFTTFSSVICRILSRT